MTYQIMQIDFKKTADEQPFDLGIEITVPKFLSGQPNLDHHGLGATIDTPSASMQALSVELPGPGSILATLRPDADSVTAMAVLRNRFEGREINMRVVRASDLFDRKGPRALSPEFDDIKNVTTSLMRMSAKWGVNMEDRVSFAQSILDGTFDRAVVEQMVAEAQKEMTEALAVSQVEVRTNAVGQKVAVVISTTRLATTIGYEHADVVVAMNPKMSVIQDGKPTGQTYLKYTVAKRDEFVPVNLNGLLKIWQTVEPGAGGRDTILGSTQNEDSVVELDWLVDLVFQNYI